MDITHFETTADIAPRTTLFWPVNLHQRLTT
ncbi:Uncharacterised protein [Vibrio cholerae]|nr:Uncharacterised protein [Vibrio cholerae]